MILTCWICLESNELKYVFSGNVGILFFIMLSEFNVWVTLNVG